MLAGRGDRVFLLGRDAGDLERSARDLEVRGGAAPGSVGSAHCDLLEPDGFAAALDAAETALDGLDAVVVTAGLFATQDALERDRGLARRTLEADFSGTVLFCEEARSRLLARGGGTLCVFSSVAGDRGRRPVVLYGAAKAGLSRYLEGLDHRFRLRGLRVVCVKPGFVRTSMTEGLLGAAFRRRSGGGRPARVAGARPRNAGGLRARDLALGDVGRAQTAAFRPAAGRFLRPRSR